MPPSVLLIAVATPLAPEPHWTAYVQLAVSAISTLGLTTLGIWIAFQQMQTAKNQWRTAQNKLKLDLFERRMAIYQIARDAVGEMFVTARSLDREKQHAYLVGIQPAKWLFGPEVVAYLETTLWEHIVAYELADSMFKGSIRGSEEYLKYQKDRANMQKEINAHYRLIDEKFGKYLILGH